MRLIDADRLHDEVDWFCSQIVGKETFHKASYHYMIDNMKTVDPVKHGRWHKISNNQWGDIDGYQCSECGEECAFPDWVEDESDEDMCLTMMKYCYNCGARMDGDER